MRFNCRIWVFFRVSCKRERRDERSQARRAELIGLKRGLFFAYSGLFLQTKACFLELF